MKLKEAKPFIRKLERIPQDSIAYEEADIMLGIRYLDLLAQREGKPLIICLALGSNSGGHTGETPLGLYLTYISRKQAGQWWQPPEMREIGTSFLRDCTVGNRIYGCRAESGTRGDGISGKSLGKCARTFCDGGDCAQRRTDFTDYAPGIEQRTL